MLPPPELRAEASAVWGTGGGAVGHELAPGLAGTGDDAVVDQSEERSRAVGAHGGDVPLHGGERRVDDLAVGGVIPGDERDVTGNGETHLMGCAQASDREHLAVVDDRRRGEWVREELAGHPGAALGHEVGRDDSRG